LAGTRFKTAAISIHSKVTRNIFSQLSGIEEMKFTAVSILAVLSFEQHLHQFAAYRRDGAANEEISVAKDKNSARTWLTKTTCNRQILQKIRKCVSAD
jgi:hypothetical protein